MIDMVKDVLFFLGLVVIVVIAVTAGDILQKEKAPVMEPIQEVGYLPKEFDESGLGNNHTQGQTKEGCSSEDC